MPTRALVFVFMEASGIRSMSKGCMVEAEAEPAAAAGRTSPTQRRVIDLVEIQLAVGRIRSLILPRGGEVGEAPTGSQPGRLRANSRSSLFRPASVWQRGRLVVIGIVVGAAESFKYEQAAAPSNTYLAVVIKGMCGQSRSDVGLLGTLRDVLHERRMRLPCGAYVQSAWRPRELMMARQPTEEEPSWRMRGTGA